MNKKTINTNNAKIAKLKKSPQYFFSWQFKKKVIEKLKGKTKR
jgi:hypothetical protein